MSVTRTDDSDMLFSKHKYDMFFQLHTSKLKLFLHDSSSQYAVTLASKVAAVYSLDKELVSCTHLQLYFL